ncbi:MULTISPECIES: ABC transporter permease [Clostridium]|uniref:ABC transporter permease n=1 Tax=Clostridium TaxID=1485 RepID=UPI000AC90FD6|nr:MULTISPECIES: ABC transporter permease [Clostridium]MDU4847373.1 ABC transporter permease [Clostridium sp.]CAH0438855.1 Putative ABC transporter, permease component [Clostridium neonatale]
MNEKTNIKKIGIVAILIYIIIGVAFYFVGGEQLKFSESNSNESYYKAQSTIGGITQQIELKQEFLCDTDYIKAIKFKVGTYARKNNGNLYVSILDNDKKLFNQKLDISKLQDNSELYIDLKDEIRDMKGKKLSILIQNDIKDENNAITLYSEINKDDTNMYINNNLNEEKLAFSIVEKDELWFGKNYWYMFIAGLLALIVYLLNLILREKHNKESKGINFIKTCQKYKFLMQQLVQRDFKTKYKRSVLGVLWSFLNPLLTMFVQYMVFSTIFKSDIPNFPVYLLSGVVVFNFFTEACGMGLMSIVGNASLITKVYMPKYIYPVSRVFSSVINLLLALIPLLIVMAITKTGFGLPLLLVPFGLICTIIFCIGMSLILSSAMVFFRDTQFLWNVVSLLWMYATPLFYPESIIPEKFSLIIKLNPMYHFIRFVRTCILNGVSPEPKAYLICIICSLLSLLVGLLIFKKTQDKFVLNI